MFVGLDFGGPAQQVWEVNYFMIMHFYIKPFHVILVILCEAKLSASNIIDPHDSLYIPMKHNVFGMRHANLVGKRVHIQTLIYNKLCCQNLDRYSQKV